MPIFHFRLSSDYDKRLSRTIVVDSASQIIDMVAKHGSILIKKEMFFDGKQYIATGEIEIIATDFIKE